MIEEQILSGTRVFGQVDLGQESNLAGIQAFIDQTNVFGPSLIVSQRNFLGLSRLVKFVDNQKGQGSNVDLAVSEDTGKEIPSALCNEIVRSCHEHGLEYFAVMSKGFVTEIPYIMPPLLDHLRRMPNLAMLGLAIDGVHDLDLLDGTEITPDNFATVFPNNAFCLHRLSISDTNGDPIPLEKRLFPPITDRGQLGQRTVGETTFNIAGNEEIALVLSLLPEDITPDVSLMAIGPSVIKRDTSQERRPADLKISRRQLVAHEYQEYYGVDSNQLADWLRNHYSIIYS